jgi:hypothetical protein
MNRSEDSLMATWIKVHGELFLADHCYIWISAEHSAIHPKQTSQGRRAGFGCQYSESLLLGRNQKR